MKKCLLIVSLSSMVITGFTLPTDPVALTTSPMITPATATPETIHHLFKSCKKGKALYACTLSGKVIAAAFAKTKSTAMAPSTTPEGIYSIYWWPKNCTPPENFKESNGCQFNLLLQPAVFEISSKKKE